MLWNLQLYNNTFEWKNVTFWGAGSKHTLTPPTYFQGVRTPQPQDLRPCICVWYDAVGLTDPCLTVTLMGWLNWSRFILANPDFAVDRLGLWRSKTLRDHIFLLTYFVKEWCIRAWNGSMGHFLDGSHGSWVGASWPMTRYLNPPVKHTRTFTVNSRWYYKDITANCCTE